MSHLSAPTVYEVIKGLTLAPVEHPELLPSLLPLILGAVSLELYFGKHVEESLGWNTSVGNAIIWVATGVNLLITSTLTTLERQMTYFIIGLGGIVGFMDFYHKWSDTLAFFVSSAGIVYSLAYVTVVVVKTDLAINETVIKGSILFIAGVNIFFKIVQQFETPANDGFGANI